MRSKLDSLKQRLAAQRGKGAPGAGAAAKSGEVEEVPSSSDDIPSPSPPGDSALVTGTMLTQAPWDTLIPMEKAPRKKKKAVDKTPQPTGGAPEKSREGKRTRKALRDGITTDCQAQLALKAAAVADETSGGAKGHRHQSRSSKVGKQLLKILTKNSKKDKKDKKKKKKKDKKEKRKSLKSRVKPDPDGSSSPSGMGSSDSSSSSTWDDDKSSSEEKDLDPPLRKRSKQRPGSVLKLLLAHARTQLDQSAKVSLDPLEAQKITEGVKMGSYFSICIRPSMGPWDPFESFTT